MPKKNGGSAYSFNSLDEARAYLNKSPFSVMYVEFPDGEEKEMAKDN